MRTNLWRVTSIVVLLAMLISPIGLAYAAPSSAQTDASIQVEDALTQQFEQQGSAGYLIYFRAKADLTAASKMGWNERGQFVLEALQKTALDKQAKVRAYLDAQGIKYQSFWIDNIIAVDSSTYKAFNGLMAFSEIQSLKARRTMGIIEPTREPVTQHLFAVESNLTHINADDVWAMGYKGQGVTIANIDTGVRYTHQAVNAQYRGNLGGGVYDHNYNWFDPIGTYPTAPGDEHGHGTHTMGTMVGDDGGANQIGMAPSADWMACRACSSTAGCPDTALLACAEFITAPTDLAGANPDPTKRPVAVNNSWGDCGTAYDPWYQGAVDAWQAAGIYPIFSNGNASNCSYASPPGLNTVGNPARYGNVTGVGSSGQNNGQYATHSNWGPTDNLDTVNPNPNDAFGAALKPQVIAPGVSIRSSVNTSDSSYASWAGTSMSSPHVTGLIALIVEAAPCLVGNYTAIETIIENTAVPVPYASGGSPAPPVGNAVNYATGHGEIDALAAVNLALIKCGNSTLSGTVTDSVTSLPIAGVAVDVVNATTNRHTITNAAGFYTINLFDGTYDVTFSKYAYTTQTINGVVLATAATLNAALVPASSSTISGVVTDAAAGWPLYASINIAGYPGGTIFTNPVNGAYSVELVDGSYTFTVSAMSGGYTDSVVPVVVAGTATQNFGLTADSSCTAPGYALGASFFSEGFEGAFPPTGWNRYELGGDPLGFLQGTTGTSGSHGSAHTGTYYAWHNDDWATTIAGIQSWMTTPQIAVPAGGGSFSFWQRGYYGTWYTYHSVLVTTGASADPAVSTYVELWNGNTAETWSQQSIDLSAYAGQNVYLAFEYEGDYSDEWYVDDVSAQGPCAPLPGYGLVTGAVFDANTGLLVPGASVQDAALHSALMIDASADPATPAEIYVIAEPGGLPVALTASATGYGPDVQSPTPTAGGTIKQDFNLPSGQLTAAPTSLTFDVTAPTFAQSLPLNLSNVGGAPVTWELFEENGIVTTGLRLPLSESTRVTTGATPVVVTIGDVSLSANANPATKTENQEPRLPQHPNATTITHSVSQTIVYGNSVACGNLGIHADNHYLRVFDLPTFGIGGSFNVTNVEIGIEEAIAGSGSVQPAEVRLYTLNGPLLFANMTLIGSAPVNVANQSLTIINVPVTGTTPANSVLVVDFFTPDGSTAGNGLYVGSNNLGQTAPTYLAAADCGLSEPTDVTDIGFPGMQLVMNVTGEAVTVPWLSALPTSGSIGAGGNTDVTVSVDATGMAGGVYKANLRIVNDTPYGDVVVPVTLNVPSFTVTFDGNGSDGGSMAAQTNNVPTALTANAFTRTGYSFVEWNTTAGGTGTPYANGATYDFSANVTLFAQWTPNSYTITFESNGGSAVAPITQLYDTVVTAPANPTKAGFFFAGWYSDALLTTPYTFSTMGLSITLYADWTAVPIQTMKFRSTGSLDGWVLESSENSGVGGSMNSSEHTFNLGDDASNRQYRAILSFDTTNLPNVITIKKATLSIRTAGLFGADPFKKLGYLTIDIRRAAFGTNSSLQLVDFEARPSKAAVGFFGKTPAFGWYLSTLRTTAYPFINRVGLTQFRLRFASDDNNNMIADYMRFFSGDAGAASRPVLTIEFTP
jgi:uncharacterized repeat protein (TIGR02543 family)